MKSCYVIRELEENDYYAGYLQLVNTFTRHPEEVSFDLFSEHLRKSKAQNSIVLVAEYNNKMIGTLKVLKEYKLHNNLTMMAHIEDVVVSPSHRKMNVGTTLLQKALEYTTDCYKVVLSCKEELIPFYSKAGFAPTSSTLTLYNSKTFKSS